MTALIERAKELLQERAFVELVHMDIGYMKVCMGITVHNESKYLWHAAYSQARYEAHPEYQKSWQSVEAPYYDGQFPRY